MPDQPTTIAMVNRKGGVQKTTTTVNTADALARRGKRVLVIDVDTQQASATTWIGGDLAVYAERPELADVLLGEAQPGDAITPSTIAGVDLLRGSVRTVDAKDKLQQRPGRDLVFRKLLKQLPPAAYDYVFFDCPASLDGIVIAALVAADIVIIPVRAQGMSLEAIDETLRLIDEIVEYNLRDSRPLVRALVTEYDGRLNHSRAVFDEVKKIDGVRTFATPTRRNEKGAEAFNFRKSIFQYDSTAMVAADYLAIADELAGEPTAVPA
jgi:chromosome partitioning protein